MKPLDLALDVGTLPADSPTPSPPSSSVAASARTAGAAQDADDAAAAPAVIVDNSEVVPVPNLAAVVPRAEMLAAVERMPSMKEIEQCRMHSSSVEELSPLRVARHFNESCLPPALRGNTNISVPFNLLQEGGDVEAEHVFIPVAALYSYFRDVWEVERARLPIQRHWDLSGGCFFSSTVLTTVGYGNFVPLRQASKWILIVTIPPALVIFGYKLNQIGMVIVSILQRRRLLLRSPPVTSSSSSSSTSSPRHVSLADLYAVFARRDEEASGNLTRQDVEAVLQHFEVRFSSEELGSLLAEADENGDGKFDWRELGTLVVLLHQRNEAERSLQTTRSNIIFSGLLSFLLLFGGTVVFMALEGWNLVDSLYFCVMTLTTIGLGDYYPSTRASQLFWHFYIIMGVGLMGVFIGLATEANAIMHDTDRLEQQRSDRLAAAKEVSAAERWRKASRRALNVKKLSVIGGANTLSVPGATDVAPMMMPTTTPATATTAAAP